MADVAFKCVQLVLCATKELFSLSNALLPRKNRLRMHIYLGTFNLLFSTQLSQSQRATTEDQFYKKCKHKLPDNKPTCHQKTSPWGGNRSRVGGNSSIQILKQASWHSLPFLITTAK